MRKFLHGLHLLLAAAAPSAALAFDLLGSESCQSCHPDAYAAWQSSAHARALESLSTLQRKDARCLSCHSPNEEDGRVVGVSCETCHGPGQYYSARYVMKDPDLSRMVGLVDPSEKACKGCHDGSSPSLRAFDFVQKLERIDHWSVERKKRATSAGRLPTETSPAVASGTEGRP